MWSLHARVLPKTAGNTLCVGSQSRTGGLCASFPRHSEVRNRSISHAQRGSYDERDQVIAECGANTMAQLHDGSSSATHKVVQHMCNFLNTHSAVTASLLQPITESPRRGGHLRHEGHCQVKPHALLCSRSLRATEVSQVRLKRTTVGPLLEEEVRWSWCRFHNQTQRST